MSLPSGQYLAIGPQDTWFSRHFIEDRSLIPKPVYFNPRQSGPPPPPVIVQNIGGDRYILKFAGSPAGVRDDSLVVYLIEDGPPAEFQLRPKDNGFVLSVNGRYVAVGSESNFGGGRYVKLAGESEAAVIQFQPAFD